MGYVHDTHMSQYIPPTAMHCVTGTWTQTAGASCWHDRQAQGCQCRDQRDQYPDHAAFQFGCPQRCQACIVEVDYEIAAQAATSITATMNKVTRGADGADATVASVTVTQDLTAGTDAADVDEHKLTVTVTTPFWIDNDEYVLLVITAIAAAGTTIDLLGAVANFTLRM